MEGAEFVAEFLEAIVGFFVCFEGEHVDGFHCFHPFLEQADLGLEGGEIFVGLGFGGDLGKSFGKFGALDGDLNDELFDFGLALLLKLGEFLLLPLQFWRLSWSWRRLAIAKGKAPPTRSNLASIS